MMNNLLFITSKDNFRFFFQLYVYSQKLDYLNEPKFSKNRLVLYHLTPDYLILTAHFVFTVLYGLSELGVFWLLQIL